MLSELGLTVSCSMVLEEDCVASESVSGGWTVEDSVLETRSGPEVSLLQAEKLKRSIPAKKGKNTLHGGSSFLIVMTGSGYPAIPAHRPH